MVNVEYTPNIPQIVFYIVFCVVGLFGNLVAVFVIVVLKEYQKSVTHWYVLQLAIANTAFLLTLPFKTTEIINDGWNFAEWTCKANESILFINYYSSILFLSVMSIDRYIAVCHPFSPFWQIFRKRTSAFIIAIVVWAISLCLSIPVILNSYKVGSAPSCRCSFEFPTPVEDNPQQKCLDDYGENFTSIDLCDNKTLIRNHNVKELYCKEYRPDSVNDLFGIEGSVDDGTDDYNLNFMESGTISDACKYKNRNPAYKAFLLFNLIGMFIVPLIIMVICYGLIVHRLYATRMRTTSTSSSASFTQSMNSSSSGCHRRKRRSTTRSDKDRIRVTVMCATLVISFLTCWIPFHAIHLAKTEGINNKKEYCFTLQRVATSFAYFTTVVNPYLYSFLGTRFFQRWGHATTITLRKSMGNRRTSSTSAVSGNSVRINHKKQAKELSTSNNQTYMTKVNKTENQYLSESKPGPYHVNNIEPASEFQETKSSDGSNSGIPLPDYDQALNARGSMVV